MKLEIPIKQIKELNDVLGELYDELAYEKAGEWVLENEDLQKKAKLALEGLRLLLKI